MSLIPKSWLSPNPQYFRMWLHLGGGVTNVQQEEVLKNQSKELG